MIIIIVTKHFRLIGSNTHSTAHQAAGQEEEEEEK
jgi:hypothetical protein